MSKYKLVYFPDARLSKACVEVVEFNEELHELLDSMKDIMLKCNGIGISANQVGSDKKAFVMIEQSSKKVVEFINPTIVEVLDTQVNDQEGCLSAPGIYVPISRPEGVIVDAFNRKGEPFRGVLMDIEARCALHEMEHLEGKNFLEQTNRQNRRIAYKLLGIKNG